MKAKRVSAEGCKAALGKCFKRTENFALQTKVSAVCTGLASELMLEDPA